MGLCMSICRRLLICALLACVQVGLDRVYGESPGTGTFLDRPALVDLPDADFLSICT